ncbi:MAG: DUF5615 family PIN-like protein [Chitinivibrionia bacterium]|nr:DUF5615 family PIN-like protein [Chitinivibrionia bacterium]
MKLKLDENLGRAEANLFAAAGLDTATITSQRMSGAPDEAVIACCRDERRCLVTMDTEFGNPILYHPWEYAGIALLRLPHRPSHASVLDACRTLIEGLKGGEIDGKLWVVQIGKIRVYQPDRPEEDI